jgi:hypothetical protein
MGDVSVMTGKDGNITMAEHDISLEEARRDESRLVCLGTRATVVTALGEMSHRACDTCRLRLRMHATDSLAACAQMGDDELGLAGQELNAKDLEMDGMDFDFGGGEDFQIDLGADMEIVCLVAVFGVRTSHR